MTTLRAYQAKNYQPGVGTPPGVLEIATLDIPTSCRCSWAVVRSDGRGNSVSRLKHATPLCGSFRAHMRMAGEAR